MQNAISSIIQSFAVGCMIFMLSLCVPYWKNGEVIFDQIKMNYDLIVLGIFLVALVAGGFGSIIYRTRLHYEKKVFIHYLTTIVVLFIVSIWLKILSITSKDLMTYFLYTSVIFFIIWYANYVKLKREAELINEAILRRKN